MDKKAKAILAGMTGQLTATTMLIDEVTDNKISIRLSKDQQDRVASMLEKRVEVTGLARLDRATLDVKEVVELWDITVLPPLKRNPEKLAALYGSAKNLLPTDKTSVELVNEVREELWG